METLNKILTDKGYLQPIHQIGSLQFNINNEDDEEGHDDEDDLPARGKASHVKLPQISEDDCHVAVESRAEEHQNCRHKEIAVESLLL